MSEKVKCKICGKVGLAKDNKGLIKHLRLAHNDCVSTDFNKEEYFEAADPDSIIEIRSISIKDWRKKQKRKLTKRLKENSKSKNPFVRIIYTPMGNKR